MIIGHTIRRNITPKRSQRKRKASKESGGTVIPAINEREGIPEGLSV